MGGLPNEQLGGMIVRLEMKQHIQGSTLRVEIIGLMDYSTIDDFELGIPDNVTKIIVDLAGLDFIDSTGIGAFLSMIYDASERGSTVEFVSMNNVITELFDTIGIFRIMESLQKGGQ